MYNLSLKIVCGYTKVTFLNISQEQLECDMLGHITITAVSLGYLEIYIQCTVLQSPFICMFLNIYGNKQIVLKIYIVVSS